MIRIALLLTLVFVPVAGYALDLRVLVDNSKELHDHDGEGLRALVIEQLVQSLPDDSKAGLWAFAKNTQRLANHAKTTGLWKQVASIHARNLSPAGEGSNLDRALENIFPDLTALDREQVHLLLVTNASMKAGGGVDTPESRARVLRDILQKWGNQFASHRVVVHTLAIGPLEQTHTVAFLQQLSELSNGMHRVLERPEEVGPYVTDLLRLVQIVPEPAVDGMGRFKIPPETAAFTVAWQRNDENPPGLKQPNGDALNRMTPLPDGRWLLGEGFEIATVQKPDPGWWQVTGDKPLRMGVFGDLQIKVDGLTSPVVPSAETSALIRLYSWGDQVVSPAFLDLLEVRATLIQGGSRSVLPVDREQDAYRAYLINLDDGAYELETEVLGPTFHNKVLLPFQASNPLRVDIKGNQQGQATAWLSFNHPNVDYSTIRATIKQRRPPATARLVPGSKQPSGLWQMPLLQDEGIVEISFALRGNYLNGEGFFLQTKTLNLQLPLAWDYHQSFRFDARGETIETASEFAVEVEPVAAVSAAEQIVGQTPISIAPGELPGTDLSNPEPAAEPLPWWVWLSGGIATLLIGLVCWWLFRPAPLELPELGSATQTPAPA